MFLSGSATVGLVVTQLDGRQEGPCYTTCEFTTAPFDYSRGVIEHDRVDFGFSYDARGGAGVSWRVWKLRVTGEAGAFHTNQYSQPHEVEAGSPVATETSGYWSYFGKATATIIF